MKILNIQVFKLNPRPENLCQLIRITRLLILVHLEKVNIPSTTDLINILTKKGGLTRQLRISQMIKEKEKGSLKTLSQTMEEKGSH